MGELHFGAQGEGRRPESGPGLAWRGGWVQEGGEGELGTAALIQQELISDDEEDYQVDQTHRSINQPPSA